MTTEQFTRTTLPCGLVYMNRYEQMLRLVLNKRHIPNCGCTEVDGYEVENIVLVNGVEQ